MNRKIKNFLYDLLISFLIALITNFLVYILSFKVINFDFLIKYRFYFYWLLLLLLILVVRFVIKKYIDKLQDDPSGFFVIQDYKGSTKMSYLGFEWHVFFNYLSEPWKNNELEKISFKDLKEVEIVKVGGPYCPNDKRKMKDTRTYWGFYKYKCPECKYKRILLKNLTTLENDTLDKIRSEFR
ncbi:hypothetical protein [Mammaliicoccus sciuri]|uniref:hypothetical protein n=1 Tax=Mammaliicoccus sciuri TaxID=1296 RepID=UPI00087863AF|nr:hypothetical protein [Mammaliicoccus sciuri]